MILRKFGNAVKPIRMWLNNATMDTRTPSNTLDKIARLGIGSDGWRVVSGSSGTVPEHMVKVAYQHGNEVFEWTISHTPVDMTPIFLKRTCGGMSRIISFAEGQGLYTGDRANYIEPTLAGVSMEHDDLFWERTFTSWLRDVMNTFQYACPIVYDQNTFARRSNMRNGKMLIDGHLAYTNSLAKNLFETAKDFPSLFDYVPWNNDPYKEIILPTFGTFHRPLVDVAKGEEIRMSRLMLPHNKNLPYIHKLEHSEDHYLANEKVIYVGVSRDDDYVATFGTDLAVQCIRQPFHILHAVIDFVKQDHSILHPATNSLTGERTPEVYTVEFLQSVMALMLSNSSRQVPLTLEVILDTPNNFLILKMVSESHGRQAYYFDLISLVALCRTTIDVV